MPGEIEITIVNEGIDVEMSANDTDVVLVDEDEEILVEVESELIEVLVENEGQQGVAGDSWTVYQAIAGQDTSQGRVVYIENDRAIYFDPSEALLYGRTLGVTKNAALTDDAVNVQLSGVMNWPDNNLTPGALYYVGANGVLTTDPTGLTVLQRVGHAIAANKLLINFDINILTI